MTRRATAFVSELRGALSLLLVLLGAGALYAQEPESGGGEATPAAEEGTSEDAVTASAVPVAYFVKRAVTVSGATIDDAVVVVEAGKIKAVGTRDKVEIPPKAKRVMRPGQVVLPGFVHVSSAAYLRGDRGNLSGAAARADESVLRKLDPTFREAQQIAKGGFTTLAVVPVGGGFSGQGVLVRPVAKGEGLLPVDRVVKEDNAVLAMGFEPSTAAKETFQKALEKARKYLDDLAAFKKAGSEKPVVKVEEKKPEASGEGKKAEEKPADGEKKDAPKDGEKKQEEAKPAEKKPEEPKADGKTMPVVDVFEHRLPGVLSLGNAAAFLHFETFFRSEKAFRPALAFTSTRRDDFDAWRVLDRLKEYGLALILPAGIGNVPLTATRRVTPRMVLDAGIPVALVPSTTEDRGEPYVSFRFSLAELVRHGVDEALVLRGATLTPAEILGIQGRCGSLDAGKDADLLFFDGEPLAPTSNLVEVQVAGEVVFATEGGRS